MINLFVTDGDITKQLRLQSIATLINGQGNWFGAVDKAIGAVAGAWYHDQARERLKTVGLKDGDVIFAKGDSTTQGGMFDNVIFVVDQDFSLPLSDLVLTALRSAKVEQQYSIGLPLMRSGKALGIREKTTAEAVAQMKLGMARFMAESPDYNLAVYVVVWNNPEAIADLSKTMKLLSG